LELKLSDLLLLFLDIGRLGGCFLLFELFFQEFNFTGDSFGFFCFFSDDLFLHLDLLLSFNTLCFLFVKELFISFDFFEFKLLIKLFNLLFD